MKSHKKHVISSKAAVVCAAHSSELEVYCHDCHKALCCKCAEMGECKSHRTEPLASVAACLRDARGTAARDREQHSAAMHTRLHSASRSACSVSD